MVFLMKPTYVAGLVIAGVLITVAIEESRISAIRRNESPGGKASASGVVATHPGPSQEEPAAPVRTRSRSDQTATPAVQDINHGGESFAKVARKMWDNPAGKSMMNQGVKMAVGMFYQDFVDGLHLSAEEADYFKNVLGREISDQQELSMKMLEATAAERKSLAEELSKRASESQAEIKKFLNNEEDFKAFTDYKNHLPERQQLDGIRTAMNAKGVPIDADTEGKIVDVMYRARTGSKAPDFSGPDAMNELAKGNLVENYEKSWTVQQEALRGELGGILNQDQMSAFQEYQKQAKEMQIMSLKMAEQMMGGRKDE